MAAREYAIPTTSTFVQDFGLNVTPPPAVRNRRVVIIGTAEDGPMYEPIPIDKPEDAELVWGRSTLGDLVRGIFECWGSQTGTPNVVGVRIGNGKQAILEIAERDSYGIYEEQPPAGTGITSLTLKARFPGSIYNQVTVRYDDRRNLEIYNPKTGLVSTFSVDTQNPNNSTVDAHNVQELADAINADRNLNSVVRASVDPVDCDYEIKINSSSTGVVNNSNGVTLNLQELLSQSGVIIEGSTDPYIVPDPILPYALTATNNGKYKNLTVANNLVQLSKIEAISHSEYEKLSFNGSSATLKYTPLDGKGTSRWDSIQALKDYDGDSKYHTSPSGNVVSEFIYTLDNVLTNEVPTDISGVIDYSTEGGDGTGNHFKLTSPLPLDDSENYSSKFTTVTVPFMSGNANYADYVGTGDYSDATCQGIETRDISETDTTQIRPSGIVRVFVSDDVDPNGLWVEVPYHTESGVYMSRFDSDADQPYMVFSVGAAASGAYNTAEATTYINRYTGDVDPVKFTNLSTLIDDTGRIKENKYIRVIGNTVKGFLNEVETLPQLEEQQDSVEPTSHYFVRGQEVLTNVVPQYPMVVNYMIRAEFEPDTNVTISDNFKGQIKFTDTDYLPGPGGGALSSTYSHIRLSYTYMPNFPNVVGTMALKKGTNGSSLNVKQREEELNKAYDYLRDYPASLWVPMSAKVGETKEQYSQDTGLKEEVSATYAQDMQDFLEELSINSIQPHAVLGTISPDEDTLAGRDEWVRQLTQVDLNDPTRPANVMANIQSKFVSVTSFEPIFLNLGRGRPYASNGQAAYAGFLSALPYILSPTNKSIPGITAQRQELSIRQHEAMNAMRYVSMRSKNGRAPSIVNDITAAPYGSDFTSWSTYSITAEASDRVKAVAETYLGRPNSTEVRNAMDQDISNALMEMQGLQAFNFTITSTVEQQVLGVVEIDIILVPIFTMKKIRTTVKLRKSLPTA